jgi:UDP:flavonoid glycosyltransferase YjiC (YdhE family)
MRIAIVTVGSLGDVQPYIALGSGLLGAGHRVRLATHAHYEASARSHGLDFFPLPGDSRAILASDAGRRWQDTGRNVFRFVRGFLHVAEPLMTQVLAQCWLACRDAELIIASVLGFLPSYQVAEKLGVPLVPAFYVPLSPTRAFPTVMLARDPALGGTFNRWTHLVAGQLLWEPLRPALNRLRREVLDLAPLASRRVTREFFAERWQILYGYSPAVLPKPADWGDRIHVTGYWFLDRPSAWQPPPGLVEFLGAGPPPVYVGFGSMQPPNAAAKTALVVRALAAAKKRGVLLTGRGGLRSDELPDGVFGVESVPHDWLFPRVEAAVHHGGAGTTAAALRAGIPSVVVPFFADQPFWGWQLARLGVAPRPIPHRRLTAQRLADAIRAATSERDVKQRAAALGASIRADDGVARAVEAIRRHWG